MKKTFTTALRARKCNPPLVATPPPFPRKRGHYKAPLCCELLMKGLLFRALFCPLNRGKSGAAGKGEASAASQSAELFSCHMIQKSKSRNVLASLLGEEGHEVAKGWTVVRMIMTLDVDVTAERRHYNTHRP